LISSHYKFFLFWFALLAAAASTAQPEEVTPEEMQVAGQFGRDFAARLASSASEQQPTTVSATQGWGTLHSGWSVNHLVLTLKGKQYSTGYGSHADAAIEISLPAGAIHLTGACGIDDTPEAKQNPHPVVFSIALDGREVWHGNPQTSVDGPAKFDVDVSHSKIVTLLAKCVGEQNSYTPADFVDLHLMLADGSSRELGQRTDWNGGGVSFVYGGKPSSQILNDWSVVEQHLPDTAIYTAERITHTDPVTHLECAVTLKRYKHFPVVEWTVNFKNNGTVDSAILENIRSMDLMFPATDKLILHHNTGDYAAEDSYEPHVTEIVLGDHLHFAPRGGRPTDKAWPYFNLENTIEHRGVIAVVGWPGQWSADFLRSAEQPPSLRISAGQELTHFILHPGEEARTPISVLMFYQGDPVRAQNIWRRWMLEENIPHPYGKLPVNVNAASLGLHQSEKTETDGIALFTSHGANLNYWWMDAGWYPCTEWWDGVGSWRPDPVRFPHGVKAVSDAAHAHDLKLILWMEPERVHPGSDLYENHPEWLLGKDGSDKLFNLGDPAAWEWMVDHVDHLIKEQGIDLYRQDFNEEALGFWRANDAPDRQGITEMRHVEGYLRLWDELHTRHPDLLIDTCASGGRRLDLETLRRSVPLWRSDDSGNPEHNQCQTYGMASWIPMFGSGTGCDTPYTIRSEMLPFFTLCIPSTAGRAMDWDLYRREAGNWAAIKDDLIGDYYPLLPYSRDLRSWIAWQFDRPDLGTGIVQAFRRPDSPYQIAQFRLHGLIPAVSYVVTDLDKPSNPNTLTGRQLMDEGMKVEMDGAPAAKLMTYVKG
jgi:alpha-galactosidase